MNTTPTHASSGWRQLVGAAATALIAVGTVLAAILLASQESGGITPTTIAVVSPTPTASLPAPTQPPSSTPAPTAALPAPTVPSATPGPSATPVPTMACPIPVGWSVYTVRLGDTLASIASTKGADVFALIEGNCLVNTDLMPGQTLYVPPLPTRSPGPTPTRVLCGPPINWVIYRVQPGDTLYGLSVRHGTTVYALVLANCLIGYTLRAGQPLYVPPVIVVPPTATRVPPSATVTATPSVSPSPSATLPPGVTPSRTPTVTPTPTTGPSVSPSPVTPTATATVTSMPLSPTPTTGATATATATWLPPSPSATLPPPTSTLPPPTQTAAPPSATPSQPASSTPVPPTASSTPVPPTARPTPSPTP